MSDTYEVHVPCGKKVLVICKEKGEDVEVKKNGETVYGENKNSNLPRIKNNTNSNLPRVKNNTYSNIPRLIETPRAAAEGEVEVEAEVETETEEEVEKTPASNENNSTEKVENEMAGGKKSRRNNARKSNATRRKNQAGGKRGPNGYMKFANKIRPQVLKEHPELKSDVVGVARKIGEKWRSLSDAEKKKY